MNWPDADEFDEVIYFVECALEGERVPALESSSLQLFKKVTRHPGLYAPKLRSPNLKASLLKVENLSLADAAETLALSRRHAKADFLLNALLELGFDELTLKYLWCDDRAGFADKNVLLKASKAANSAVGAAATLLLAAPHLGRAEQHKLAEDLIRLNRRARETFHVLFEDWVRTVTVLTSPAERLTCLKELIRASGELEK